MEELKVGSREFRDLDSYRAAKRDQLNIDKMKSQVDMNNIEEVKTLYAKVSSGRYKFGSILGTDFEEELEDLIRELEKKEVLPEKNGKKVKYAKNKVNHVNITKDFSEYDDALKQEILKNIKHNEVKRSVMIGVLSLVCIGCVAYLVFYFAYYAKNDSEYKELVQLKEDTVVKNEVSINLEVEKDKPPILKKYENLYSKNRKIIGWLKVDGTNIDYPVMQTINNDYYLDHNYNQDYDKNGSIFMDKDCTPAFPNDNMIIYGHHMKSGKMFGQLNYYAKESFYKEHPQIYFDTIYEEGIYDVMYVFRSQIYSEEEIVFKYYKFIDATSEDEFYSNMDEMRAISLYDTGISANYGDKLITLSTCDNSEAANGRFVVVAKKVK